MSPRAKQPCLEVVEGRSLGRVFVLDRVRSYVIGRLPGAEIHIGDHGVSRRHVRVTRHEDGRIEAADMRSTNGLFVNGERVERAVLDAGDRISLGPDAVLRLDWVVPGQAEAEPSSAPRAPAFAPAPEPGGSPARASEQTSPISAISPSRARASAPRPTTREASPLSERQLEVGRLVAAGLTNAAIGEALGISTRTVTTHLDHVYGRLGIGSRAALTRWLAERGLLEPSDA